MREKTKELCYVALSAAVLCVFSPWSVYIGGIPITLSFFAILLISWLFKPRIALGATLVYVALGAVGVPVFAGFVGGFQVIVGPTGGFIMSYPLVALIASKFGTTTAKKIIFGILCAILSYILGFSWLSFTTDSNFLVAAGMFSIIFAICDLIKILTAATLSEEIKRRTRR